MTNALKIPEEKVFGDPLQEDRQIKLSGEDPKKKKLLFSVPKKNW